MDKKHIYIIISVGLLLFGCKSKTEEKTYFVKDWHAVCEYSFNDTSKYVVTCRVWGILKYFHPNITAGKIDWDEALLNSLESINHTQDIVSFNRELWQLIAKAGPYKTKTKTKKVDISTNINLDMCWVNHSFLNDDIIDYLLDIVTIPVKEQPSYYLEADERYTTVINEKNYSIQLVVSDDRYKLLSLFRYWNAVYFFFSYKYQMNTSWDDALYEYIPKFLKIKTVNDYHRQLALLAAIQNEGHSNYSFRIWPRKQACVVFETIDGETYIKHKENDSFLRYGDKIVEIDNMDIHTLIDSMRPYISATNELFKNYSIKNFLTYSHNDTIIFTVQRDNDLIRIKEKTFLTKRIPSFDKSEKILPSNIGYVHLASIPSPKAVDHIFTRFEETKAIILDLRCYPKSSIMNKIFPYINFDYENFELFPVVKPDMSSPGRYYWEINLGVWKEKMMNENQANKYDGKIIVLVDETTISYAETLAMIFREMSIPIIGRTTAAANGNVFTITLPGNIKMYFSSVGIATKDSIIIQGVVPDVVVYPTVESVRKHEDEILQKALSILTVTPPPFT